VSKLLFSRIDNTIKKFEELVLMYGIIALSGITVSNVISRVVFNYSWFFIEEISQFILVIITFMGISYGARINRHIRMTALFEIGNDKVKKILIVTTSLITMLVLFYLSYHAFLFVMKTKAYGRVSPALRIPFYLLILWAPSGLFLGGVQYLITLIKNIRESKLWLSSENSSSYKEIPY
jgi:TRAP-type C4-dicarboxylate transport system permease small subunit